MASELENTPPQILEGVPETLAYLAKRHRLILLTKGEAAEQAGKVERSGLQSYFDAIEIVVEKNAGDLPAADRAIQNREVTRLDGGKQSAHRHQPGAAGGTERGSSFPIPQPGLSDKADVESGSGRLLILSAFRELRAHF